MKCVDALRKLESTQAEFDRRHFLWCLEESERELDSDFALVRRFPSSKTFTFLDFIEQCARDEILDLMTANLKFHLARAAGLAGSHTSPEESEMRQRYLAFGRPEIVLRGQRMHTLYVSPREKEIMRRDLEGETRLWEPMERKNFKAILREHLDPLLGRPESRRSVGLEYCVPIGPWYLLTQIDLTGKSQLQYSHSVCARRTQDLCTCTLKTGHAISLLGWCGIHPSTSTSLIQAHELHDIADFLRAACARVVQEAPQWLAGLDHDIPEAIEDGNTWLDDRLAVARRTGLQ